jgi:hypothetical protein
MTATQTLTGDAPRERDAEARAVVATWTPEKLAAWRDLLRETQAHLCGLVDMLHDGKVSDLLCRLAELERLADEGILRRMGPLSLPALEADLLKGGKVASKVSEGLIKDIRAKRSGT